MSELYEKIVDLVKLLLQPQVSFGIAIICLLLIIPKISTFLGLTPYVNDYRYLIGIVFLVSSVFFIVTQILIPISSAFLKLAEKLIQISRIKKYLQILTKEEKALLRLYIKNGEKTVYLREDDGVVAGLKNKNIIYRSTNIGGAGFNIVRFAYNINDGVWDYLNKNPEFIDIGDDYEYDTDSGPTGGYSDLIKML